MCVSLMRSVTHDGSFFWMFGEDTRLMGRFMDFIRDDSATELRFILWGRGKGARRIR